MDLELLKRVGDLIESIGTTNYTDAHQTNEMFNLNNLIFPNLKEFGKSCSTCRLRVYHRLKSYWETNKNNLEK